MGEILIDKEMKTAMGSKLETLNRSKRSSKTEFSHSGKSIKWVNQPYEKEMKCAVQSSDLDRT